MDSNHQDKCWHECGERGTLVHQLWECPAVTKLWSEVIAYMSEYLNVSLSKCPRACILGLKPDNITSGSAHRLWTLACLATKRLILLNWKERKPACFSKEFWQRDFQNLLDMERATSLLGDCSFEGRPSEDPENITSSQ